MDRLRQRGVGDQAGDTLERALRAVLVVDAVEYGRLTEADEAGAVAHWFGIVDAVKTAIMPAHRGKLVKELGDGLLIAFDEPRPAVAAAFAIQALAQTRNAGLPHDRQMHLRIGLECAEVIVDHDDVHGRGVNLAARLTQLAGPGDIVISAAARDRLIPSIDAEVEDLGLCYVKHRKEPVRAFRIGPPGTRPQLAAGLPVADLYPTLAVLPFRAVEAAAEHRLIGQVLADEVIEELSRAAGLNVISRLSTASFRDRDLGLSTICARLAADYVVSGRFRAAAGQVVLDAELAEASSGRVVWSVRLQERVDRCLHGDREIIGRLVGDVALAVMRREVERARSRPLPTLESYTLLLAGITLMHRLSPQDFTRARLLLETLIERAPRQSIPLAWLAKWHVLKVQQGWAEDQKEDAARALELTRRALDTDPECALALTMDGLVQVHLTKRLDRARQRYDAALAVNPSDSLAWLLRGTLFAFTDDGGRAVDETSRALKLSPLDPQRFYFDALAATAQLTARRYDRAVELAERSLLANRSHTSTLRVMAIGQWYLGRHAEARRSVQELLKLEPNLTIGRYLERSPAAPFATGRAWADALQAAGVPA